MRQLTPAETQFLSEMGMELFQFIARKYKDAKEKKVDFTAILEHAAELNKVTILDA